MISIAGNDNRRVKQTMLYFKRVAIFRNKLYPNIRDALRILLSEFIGNAIFSIEMNRCM